MENSSDILADEIALLLGNTHRCLDCGQVFNKEGRNIKIFCEKCNSLNMELLSCGSDWIDEHLSG